VLLTAEMRMTLKKYTRIIFMLSVLTRVCFGQGVDSLGIDNDPFLNRQESQVLNQKFRDFGIKYDFTGKKIAFFGGSSGTTLRTKQHYFSSVIDKEGNSYSGIMCQVVVLTEKEIKRSGGFDSIIISNGKVLLPKPSRKMLKAMRRSANQ